ncbi:glycosyltransferase family 2 protein [Litorivicinus lipolyticus]|nr:glycosyltransferase family 2 protein [Litorivicinus lipolyticus]
MSTDQCIGVVFVSYNCGRDIAELIGRLKAQPVAGYRFTYVVVDNASADDSVERLAGIVSEDVVLIESPQNLGFGRGCNLAFEHTQHCDRVLLMNPDIELFDDSVEQLLACAERVPAAGIWGGVTLGQDRLPDGANAWREPRLWHSLAWATWGDQLCIKATGTSVAAYPKSLAVGDSPYPVDAVSGCFLLIDQPMLTTLGGFDDRFFMYSEEIDLCRRARALGAQPTVCPSAQIIHEGSATVTSVNRLKFMHGARLKYFTKHSGALGGHTARALTGLGVGIRLAAFGAKSLIDPDAKIRFKTWLAVACDRSVWSLR